MAEKANTGAETSPFRSVEVRGDEITYDAKRAANWKSFELSCVIADESASVMEKSRAIFELIEYVTDLTKEDIVERCGGEDAGAADVMAYALEVIAGTSPKN